MRGSALMLSSCIAYIPCPSREPWLWSHRLPARCRSATCWISTAIRCDRSSMIWCTGVVISRGTMHIEEVKPRPSMTIAGWAGTLIVERIFEVNPTANNSYPLRPILTLSGIISSSDLAKSTHQSPCTWALHPLGGIQQRIRQHGLHMEGLGCPLSCYA